MIVRVAALAALAFAAPALAQTAQPTPAPPVGDPGAIPDSLDPASLSRDRVTILGGIATIPSYDGAATNRLIPAAAIQGTVGGYAFQSSGLRLYADALRNRPGPVWDVQFGPVAGLNLDRTRRSAIDDPRVAALGTRKTAIELGGFAGLGKTGVVTSDYDKLTASLTILRDVNGAHDSMIVTPALDYGTPLSPRAYAGLSLAADHVGGGYADTYFSVTAPGARAGGLPVFDADGGWKDWSLTGFATVSLTGDLLHGLGLVAGARYSRLLGDFARSPVVSVAGDRDQWSGTLGLSYTF